MITKEECKEFAVKIKAETGNFPKFRDWRVCDGYPTSGYSLLKLFPRYNEFRDYCNEVYLVRSITENITLEWLKNNSTVNNKGCWVWNKSPTSAGYGRTSYNGQDITCHRLSYCLKTNNFNILSTDLVRHTCHNKLCCNPDHLKLGTNVDNALDSREFNKSTKLTKEKVIEIRKDVVNWDFNIYGNKKLFKVFWSKKFKIHETTIDSIIKYQTWKNIVI